MDQKNLLIMIVLLVVIGGAAFYGGMQYQKTKSPFGGLNRNGSFVVGQNEQNGQMRVRTGNGEGIQPVRGEIVSRDDKSLTVKMPDGSSKIVVLSGSTSINKASQGTTEDLKAGEQVMVIGTTNSDGSVTAKNIHLGEVGGFGLIGGQRQGSQSGGTQPRRPQPAPDQGGDTVFFRSVN